MPSLRLAPALLSGLSYFTFASATLAGGYDTPILYSARHQGMGGTAISFVDDASAVFHNPGGLGQIEGVNLLADFSLLTGTITSSPGAPDLPDANRVYPARTSERLIAPLFLVGAAYRLAEPVTLGLAVFPVASAAGEYRNTSLIGNPTIDKTRLVFIEASPAVSVTLVEGVSVGVGYRVTLASLERVKGNTDNPQEFDFIVSGVDAAGFRAGAEWQATEYLDFGAVYRHKISPTLKADSVTAGFLTMTDAETRMVLPSKVGVGASAHADAWRVALDVEYGFQSQNDSTTLSAYNAAQNRREEVTNYFEWQDAVTLRLGGEYGFGTDAVFPVRVGYAFDGQVSNKGYPSAFGTPPAPGHSFSLGAGYRKPEWQLNVAGVYRTVATEVSVADVADSEPCATCGQAGPDYSLGMVGAYIDFSIEFDVAPLL